MWPSLAGLDEVEELIQQRVVLHLPERLGVAGQVVDMQCGQAGAHHAPLEQQAQCPGCAAAGPRPVLAGTRPATGRSVSSARRSPTAPARSRRRIAPGAGAAPGRRTGGCRWSTPTPPQVTCRPGSVICSIDAAGQVPERAGGVAGNGGGSGCHRLSPGHRLTGAAGLQVPAADAACRGDRERARVQPPNTVLTSSGS